MAVKTLTYQRLIGNKWVGMSRGANNVEADMDALLSDGWAIMSDNITPGDGRTFGLRVKRDRRVITYHKA